MNKNVNEIREDIVSAIIMADCADVVDRWACESQVIIGDKPADPVYSVFAEFYGLAERLKKEYNAHEIKTAVEQFPYDLRQGRCFLMSPFSERTRELKMIEYCLKAVEEKKDVEIAFRRWID